MVETDINSDGGDFSVSEPADEMPKKPKRESPAVVLTDYVTSTFELVHGEDGRVYGRRNLGDKRLLPLEGSAESVLAVAAVDIFHGRRMLITSSIQREVAGLLTTMAAGLPREQIFVRYAYVGNALFVDLCDDAGRIVRIDDSGWNLQLSHSINFTRTPSMRPIQLPDVKGDFERIFDFFPVVAEHRPLIRAWCVSACDPSEITPILLVLGEQGSGKSLGCSFLSRALNPSNAESLSMPSDERDWLAALAEHYVPAFDNVSGVSSHTSDLLAQVVTGTTITVRKMYTNYTSLNVRVQRPLIFNGIGMDGAGIDLKARMVTLHFPPIENFGNPTELLAAFEEALPAITAGLWNLISLVLQTRRRNHLVKPPRLTGYAEILDCLDDLLGTDGYRTYRDMLDSDAAEVREADPLVQLLSRVVTRPWEGTARQLLDRLESGTLTPSRGLPWMENAAKLSTELRRILPSLRSGGWTASSRPRAGADHVTMYLLTPPSATGRTGATGTDASVLSNEEKMRGLPLVEDNEGLKPPAPPVPPARPQVKFCDCERPMLSLRTDGAFSECKRCKQQNWNWLISRAAQ